MCQLRWIPRCSSAAGRLFVLYRWGSDFFILFFIVVQNAAEIGEAQSTLSSVSPWTVMGVLLDALVLPFPLLMVRPSLAELSATMFVFSCICCWVWERSWQSLGCPTVVHWIMFRILLRSSLPSLWPARTRKDSGFHFEGVGDLCWPSFMALCSVSEVSMGTPCNTHYQSHL
ncbi:hypothetical protein DPMN_080966 [Dreissena polymorpha]|uniref:Uncharacterized protein n=1 Tax=Dreissena polymorpha TaxID=45954 RepID=A0A9D4BHB0_DREPO|nr:hypothetical protein DPMN_080966 [Dreissena polymorpha]